MSSPQRISEDAESKPRTSRSEPPRDHDPPRQEAGPLTSARKRSADDYTKIWDRNIAIESFSRVNPHRTGFLARGPALEPEAPSLEGHKRVKYTSDDMVPTAERRHQSEQTPPTYKEFRIGYSNFATTRESRGQARETVDPGGRLQRRHTADTPSSIPSANILPFPSSDASRDSIAKRLDSEPAFMPKAGPTAPPSSRQGDSFRNTRSHPPWIPPLDKSGPAAARDSSNQGAIVQDLRDHAEAQGADLSTIKVQTQALTETSPDFDDTNQCAGDKRSASDQGREATMALYSYPAKSGDQNRFFSGVPQERKEEITRVRQRLRDLEKQLADATKHSKDEVSASLQSVPAPTSPRMQR